MKHSSHVSPPGQGTALIVNMKPGYGRDALLDSLVEIGSEALDALSPDERNQLYRILQLKVVLKKDAMPELSGVFGQGLDVCALESQP